MDKLPDIIHILGASGSGTSTIGKAISEKYGHVQLDTDDYFWIPTDPKFTVIRERGERQTMLAKAIEDNPRCVISGSLCGWGDIFINKFQFVILVETPVTIRIQRLKQREYNRFGERISPGGDMYNEHIKFLDWAAQYDDGGNDMRSYAMHENWLKSIKCPIKRVDGTCPADEILSKIFAV